MIRLSPLLSSCALLACTLLGACAQTAAPPRQLAQAGEATTTVVAAPTDPTDPFEATNRRVLDLNFRMDDALFRPVAEAYRQALGPWPRARIRNVLENINEPAVFANRLLQGKPIEAGVSLMRFVINSTLGLGGLFDLEPIGGPPKQVADLGQTLAVWGLGDGPYLMLPFVGPSNPRELAGMIGNGFLNPISYPLPLAANLGRGAGLGLDERERNIETIEELRTGSLDAYARLRSLWRQHRDAELGRTAPAEPDVLDDPGADAAAPGPPGIPLAAAAPAAPVVRPAKVARRQPHGRPGHAIRVTRATPRHPARGHA